jgi:hypothetical protein
LERKNMNGRSIGKGEELENRKGNEEEKERRKG